MSKKIAGRDAILAACESLLEQHNNDLTEVTVLAVREAVGGGSSSTIAPIVAEFRDSFGGVNSTATPPATESIRKRSDLLVMQIYAEAKSAAEREFEERRAFLDRMQQRAELDTVRALEQVEQLTAKLASIEAERDAAMSGVATLETTLANEQEIHSHTVRELESARVRISVLEDSCARADLISSQFETFMTKFLPRLDAQSSGDG